MRRFHSEKFSNLKQLCARQRKWFALLLVLVSINCFAVDFHAHKDIRKTAEVFLQNNLEQTHSDKQAPRLVQAGQEVILLATTPQLEVRMKGKALSDGFKGDIIQVRNVRSKRVIQGIVTHAGVVRVNM